MSYDSLFTKSKLKCENREGSIVRPGCYGNSGAATKRVTVVYHENPFSASGETADCLSLCPTCERTLTGDAQSHGYTVRSEGM